MKKKMRLKFTMLVISILFLAMDCSTENVVSLNSKSPTSLATGNLKPMNTLTAPCDPTPYITSITLLDLSYNPVTCGHVASNTNYYIKVSGKVSSFCFKVTSGASLLNYDGTINSTDSTCLDMGFSSPYTYGDIGYRYLPVKTLSTSTSISGHVMPYDDCAGPEPLVNFNFYFTPGTTLTFTYNNGVFDVVSNYPVGDNLTLSGNIKAYSDNCVTLVGKDGFGFSSMNVCSSLYNSSPNNTMSCSAVNYKFSSLSVNGQFLTSNGSVVVNGNTYNVVASWSCTPFTPACP